MLNLTVHAAYHVDEFPQHLQVKVAKQLVCTVHTVLHIQRKVIIAVLNEGDIVIINPFRFVEKYNQLTSEGWHEKVIPLNIAGIAPFTLNSSPCMRDRVESSLIDACGELYEMCMYSTPDPTILEFSVQESDIRVIKLNIDPRVVGRDFFLGWILDYTCIYHIISPHDDDDDDTPLSLLSSPSMPPKHCIFFQRLLRVTITAVCGHNRINYKTYVMSNSTPTDTPYMVTLKQFTVPFCYLNPISEVAFKQLVAASIDELQTIYLPRSSVVEEIVLTYDEVLLDSFKI